MSLRLQNMSNDREGFIDLSRNVGSDPQSEIAHHSQTAAGGFNQGERD